jgi:predicted RNase H-like nuclease (RuvC/YqgF family)
MATRTKLTPFARLFLVLIFIVPLAYGGALYIQGKDPIAEVQAMFKGDKSPSSNTTSTNSSSTYDPQEQIKKLKKENQQLQKRVEELEAELKAKGSKNSDAQKWGN